MSVLKKNFFFSSNETGKKLEMISAFLEARASKQPLGRRHWPLEPLNTYHSVVLFEQSVYQIVVMKFHGFSVSFPCANF